MKKLLAILFGITITLTVVNGQKYYLTNQYVYDLFQMNPSAAAFQKNCITMHGFYQKQWLGTDLAPSTQILSLQMPVGGQMGSGTYIYNDRNGNYKELGLNQAFSYEILLLKKRKKLMTLSFGLSFLLEQTSLDMSNLLDGGAFDPIITGAGESGFGFNASTGALLKYNETHIGFAITNLLPETNSMYQSMYEPDRVLDFNLHAGGSFKVADRDLYLEPLFMFRKNVLTDSRMDLNLKAYLPTPNPDWSTWGLVAYRHTVDHKFGKSLGLAFTGGVVYQQVSLGLEYQLGLTRAQIDYGSNYQLVLSYRICRERGKGAIPCSKIRRNRKSNYQFLGY
ncbi:PorP/SprF family type IX secretion system membrane protein [Carboxylicivirga caseinilyticus]|uniref:PorP/SprF family type IX secretion system membrane protein n=1 Tax=Carboxylicivirga caseinilyticus TaxID=3417572 RepID=UPI003D34DD10|nr:PorP/SprF family type IX secretion system membrane protein [Marinilabiliaceae bacterium A049]